MEKVLCCLYDKVARKYFAPSCFDNEDCAKRDAEALFREHFGARCKDYVIVRVGTFSPDKGSIKPAKTPDIILDGSSIVIKEVE